MAENKQSNVIASVKILKIASIKIYTTNSEIERGGYAVLVNY